MNENTEDEVSFKVLVDDPGFPGCNVYLIIFGERKIIFDPSSKKNTQKVLKQLETSKIPFLEITEIIISHAHFDHVNGIHVLKEKTKSKIIGHKISKEYVERGNNVKTGGIGLKMKFILGVSDVLFYFQHKYKKFSLETIAPEEEKDGKYYFCKDCYAVHTPGHSVDSISIVITDKNKKTVALVGDLVYNTNYAKIYPSIVNNLKSLFKSWKFLLDLGVEEFYPGHGEMVTRKEIIKVYNELNKEKYSCK